MSTEPLVGILRAVGAIEEKANKAKQLWYSREMTFDTGQSYKLWDTNKDKLINLDQLIDTEITYSIGEKGQVILHGLPEIPKKTIPKPRKVEGQSREGYWEDKSDWDRFISGLIERQYYITLAKDFCIPMGRITDGNWKELAEEAVKLGIELHQKYGKTEV